MGNSIPGDGLARRALHVFLIADASGSMKSDGKVQALNHAVREAIPHMQAAAQTNAARAEAFVHAVQFSTGARTHVPRTPLAEFKWRDLDADGETYMGQALALVADQLEQLSKEKRQFLPPVLVLLSDGQPTDDFDTGLRALREQWLGEKAVRLAIAIGQDADHDVLERFIGRPGERALQANNAEALTQYLRWATSDVVRAVSSPMSQPAVAVPRPPGAAGAPRVDIPGVPSPPPAPNAPDVW